MAKMKKTDYTVNLGILKKTYRRGVDMNGFKGNVEVVLSQNHNKGLIELQRKVSDSLIPDDDELFDAIQEAYNALEIEARKEGVAWRDNWKRAQKEKEEATGNASNQLGIPGVDDED